MANKKYSNSTISEVVDLMLEYVKTMSVSNAAKTVRKQYPHIPFNTIKGWYYANTVPKKQEEPVVKIDHKIPESLQPKQEYDRLHRNNSVKKEGKAKPSLWKRILHFFGL